MKQMKMKWLGLVLLAGLGIALLAPHEAEARTCNPITQNGSSKHLIRTVLHKTKQACRTAERNARNICKKRGQLQSFQVTRRKRKKRFGKGSECTVYYSCRIMPFGCGSVITRRGTSKHLIRTVLHKTKQACRTAERNARNLCRKHGKLQSFRVTRRQRKKRFGKGSECTVTYECRIQR